jgi:serine/threonine-protein kinase
MGRVYRAVQVPLGRCVALKVLSAALAEQNATDFHRRFFLEAATAARLSHPNAVTIFDYGRSDDGIYYIAMEYLAGPSLRQVLKADRPLPPQRAVDIALQIARAVGQAHAIGFMHRDIKPANVIVQAGDDGRDFVKVLDFGLAKSAAGQDDLTRTGQFLGSPGYMAPEQIRGRAIDARCDIYALGALLYEMLTGRPPFPRESALQTMMAHVHEAVPSFADASPHLRLPHALEAAVRTCLSKAPADRPADMAAAVALVSQAASSLPPQPAARALQEYESSGWAVVSPTGALRLAAEPTPDAAAPTLLGLVPGSADPPEALAPTVLGTLAVQQAEAPTQWAIPAPQPDPGPAPAPPRVSEPQPVARRPSKGWTVAVLMAVGAVRPGLQAQREAEPAAPHVLRLDSQPAGAEVWHGDMQLCAATPCEVRWQPDAGQKSLCLRFALMGYDEHVVSRRLKPGGQAVCAALGRSAAP